MEVHRGNPYIRKLKRLFRKKVKVMPPEEATMWQVSFEPLIQETGQLIRDWHNPPPPVLGHLWPDDGEAPLRMKVLDLHQHQFLATHARCEGRRPNHATVDWSVLK